MKDLNVFISYSHEDYTIAQELRSLLIDAFGPCLHVDLDKISISFGDSIKDAINQNLERADILIAIMTNSQPVSFLSWPAYEVGIFRSLWRQGKPNRDRGNVVGQIAMMVHDVPQNGMALGPEAGNRPINLGFSASLLSDPRPEEVILASVAARSELRNYLNDIENLLRAEPDYEEFFRNRPQAPAELVKDFNQRTFRELKRRVRNILKPSRQLLIRYNTAATTIHPWELPDDAKIASVGGAADIFGKQEGDPPFAKSFDSFTQSVRFESTWRAFRESVERHSNGPYWCDVLAQVATGATLEGTEWDQNLVLVSTKDQRYRVISTTVTKYFNGEAEVSIYLIEALKRQDHGDPKTSQILRALNLICRFRFAFLEKESQFFWVNFPSRDGEIKKARALQIELDFLESETKNANLDVAGIWTDYMTIEQLNAMTTIWADIRSKLRAACNGALAPGVVSAGSPKWTGAITEQRKRVSEDVRPYNTLLGEAISARLHKIFKDEMG